MAWCGAGLRLKGRMRWKQQLWRLYFSLRCLRNANGIHRRSICHVRFSLFLAGVWFGLLGLCVMSQPLNQACSLRRCYFVHVAGQLGHTLLKPRTLNSEEGRSAGPWVVQVCLHVTTVGVCNEQKDTKAADKQ